MLKYLVPILLLIMVLGYPAYLLSKYIPPYDKSKIALLVVGTWENPVTDIWINNGYEVNLLMDRWNNEYIPNLNDNLVPLLFVFTHINQAGATIASEVRQEMFGEPIIESASEMEEYLKSKEVDIILYAGYHYNLCLMDCKVNIAEMYNRGFRIKLVEDCTLKTEYGYNPEEVKKQIIFWGGMTDTEEIREVLSH